MMIRDTLPSISCFCKFKASVLDLSYLNTIKSCFETQTPLHMFFLFLENFGASLLNFQSTKSFFFKLSESVF